MTDQPAAIASGPGKGDFLFTAFRHFREYFEVTVVIAAITVVGWFVPGSYRAFGHIYLLAVILLCLRVSRWPVLFAAVVSALAWNFVIVPPRLSFSVLHLEDVLILGTYFVVALIAGQLTARIRGQELLRRQGEQRATALYNLTRAFAAARSLDEAIDAAMRQADALFETRTAVYFSTADGTLVPHAPRSSQIGIGERELAELARAAGRAGGRTIAHSADANALYFPLVRDDAVLGVFVVAATRRARWSQIEVELIEAFAAQIALYVERERFRQASEREKLLAESDRLHRTLLDSVSHELKTPLAVLRSAAEGLAGDTNGRTQLLVAEIGTATRRLDRLVANLLNQTRLESGALKPNLVPCDLHDIVANARRAIGSPLQQHPLQVDFPPELPLIVADAPLLEQAVENLLINASVHTPPETRITMRAEVARGGDWVALTIADSGPGLPREVRQAVFEKFHRGDHAPAGGVGLGLSIVRGFVVAQSGEIVADEAPGGGARFTLYLRRAAHAAVPIE